MTSIVILLDGKLNKAKNRPELIWKGAPGPFYSIRSLQFGENVFSRQAGFRQFGIEVIFTAITQSQQDRGN